MILQPLSFSLFLMLQYIRTNQNQSFQVSLSSTEADAPPAPPPSDADAVPRRAARLDASAVHRMVSSHIVRKETKETKEAKESTDAGGIPGWIRVP